MNMYVSNLGFKTTDEGLRRLFESFGEVSSAKIITDRETGRSRGFGFVEMTSEPDAQKAMNNLNGADFEGRNISVTIAREKPKKW